MSQQFVYRGLAQEQNLAIVIDGMLDFGRQQAWPEPVIAHVHLVLEEVIVNIISYGAQDNTLTEFELLLEQTQDGLHIQISDNAAAFNPLQVPPPDLDADLDERSVGGLGIYLLTQLTNSQSYRRDGNWNRLQLTKIWAPAAAQADASGNRIQG